MKKVNPTEIVEIVQRYSNFIHSICRKFYIVGGTSEDLYQEGVIGILEACKSFNGESLFDEKFDAFVKICIKRQIYDAIRKSNTLKNKALNEAVSIIKVDNSGEEKSLLDTFLDRTISNDPLDICIDKEKINERLSKCEKKLSEFELQVLNHYLEGEKQSEIAKVLKKDTKSIDNTIQRIKKKLK